MPWVPSMQLDDDRRAANSFDGREHIPFVAHKGRFGDSDVVATEDLQAAQLVARVRDTGGRIRAENIHLLKLPHHCITVMGDRSADPGQHSIVVREAYLAIKKIRLALFKVNSEFERVQNLNFVSTLFGGFAQRRVL